MKDQEKYRTNMLHEQSPGPSSTCIQVSSHQYSQKQSSLFPLGFSPRGISLRWSEHLPQETGKEVNPIYCSYYFQFILLLLLHSAHLDDMCASFTFHLNIYQVFHIFRTVRSLMFSYIVHPGLQFTHKFCLLSLHSIPVCLFNLVQCFLLIMIYH